MRHTTTPRPEGVTCSKCGTTKGQSANIGQGGLRCSNCGRFAKKAHGYCAKHGVNWGDVTGYDHCPMCREEERVEQQRQEMMARKADPNMHPTVDAHRR